jgi:hypothetical protein
MLQYYRIIRDAAERIAEAAEATTTALRDGRLEQEPAFTDRMLGRIEQAMDGYSHHGVSWKAKTLTDRAQNAQESEFGADFFAVLEIKIQGYSVTKGFLAQAKLIEPNESMRSREFEEMQGQCAKMLKLSPASYVFLYSQAGITVVPALAVVGSARLNPHNLYQRSVSRFYEEHLASFIGDQRISAPNITTLEVLAADFAARSGLQLIARTAEGTGGAIN